MSKAAKINLIIVLTLTALVVAGIAVMKHHHPVMTTVEPPVLVELGHPQEILIPNAISSTGNLEAIEQTNISAKTAGYVTQINYHEGTDVDKGAILVQLDNRKEQAAVDSAKAQADMSQLKYQQLSKMYHRRLESYDNYYSSKITHEEDQAALETAETSLTDKQIRAPFAGKVGAKQISIGDYIQPGNTLLTLTDLNKLRVTYAVPSSYLDAIKVGQTVVIDTPAMPSKHFRGQVSYIAPNIDTSSQTVTVHADINNDQGLLRPGLYVTINQLLGNPMQATAIPATALFASLKGYYVLAVKDGKAYKLPVKVGRKFNGQVQVLSGLTLNSPFIIQGQGKVQPGSAVTIYKINNNNK